LTTDTGQRHAYGWRPSPPDKRDYRYQARVDPATLPASVDLAASLPPAWDQSQLGSCTAFTGAAAVVFDLVKQGIGLAFVPSFLFLYYNERKDDGTIPVDAGSSMREIAKALAKYGLAHDAFWPYNISRFADAPPAAAYDDGLKTVLTQYLAVAQDVNAIKSCLADGYPVMVGISVYQSFENAGATGDVPMPTPPNDRLLGGHALLVVGYNDATGRWKFRNSWGTSWGKSGYGTLPYAFLADAELSDDFWTLRQVSGAAPAPTPDPTPAPSPAVVLTCSDDKANARATFSWNAFAGAGAYVLDFGKTPDAFTQSIPVGLSTVQALTYPKDSTKRYGRVRALVFNTTATAATSNVVDFGPAVAPSPTPPGPTPPPAPTRTHRIDVYSDGSYKVDASAWAIDAGACGGSVRPRNQRQGGDVGMRSTAADVDLSPDSPLNESQR
jgi:hypothetical protein